MFCYQGGDPGELAASKPATVLEPYGLDPELGPVVLALHVNVPAFGRIARVKEEAVRTDPQDGGPTLNTCRERLLGNGFGPGSCPRPASVY